MPTNPEAANRNGRRVWRRLSCGIAVVAVSAVSVLWAAGYFGGDMYHFRSTRSWLKDYGLGPADYHPSPAADAALRHIGPAAVPYLLQLLHSTNSIYETKLVHKQPVWNNVSWWRRPWILPDAPGRVAQWINKHTPYRLTRSEIPPSWQHWQAFVGFRALGAGGRTAIPDLAKLAWDSASSNGAHRRDLRLVLVIRDLKLGADYAAASDNYYGLTDSPRFFSAGHSGPSFTFLTDGEIAAWSLAAIGADAVPTLLKLLDSPDRTLKLRAMVALELVGPEAEAAVPALLGYLGNSATKPDLPASYSDLRNPNVALRCYAAAALGLIGRQPAMVVPTLIQNLTNYDEISFFATEALGEFGDRATNAIPFLLAKFSPPDKIDEVFAAVALTKIAPELAAKDIIPVMVSSLHDTNLEHRNEAVYFFGQMIHRPDLAIPALISAITDTDEFIQRNAIESLGDFGPAAKAAVPTLMLLATNTNSPGSVMDYSVSALDRIDPLWESRR